MPKVSSNSPYGLPIAGTLNRMVEKAYMIDDKDNNLYRPIYKPRQNGKTDQILFAHLLNIGVQVFHLLSNITELTLEPLHLPF